MNILVLSHLYPRPQDPSYGIFVHRQVKQLQKFGHNAIVLSPIPWAPKILHFSSKWRNYGLAPKSYVLDGVEISYPSYLRFPGNWFRWLAGYTVYTTIYQRVLELHHQQTIDVVYSNTLLPDGLAGLLLGQKLELPTVCAVRGPDVTIEPYENRINFRVSKNVVCNIDQIVAVSRALKYEINKLGLTRKDVRVVYNGVTVEDPQETEPVSIQQIYAKVQSVKPYILFVGRDIRRKGLKDLLAAFAQLMSNSNYNLVVIGPTSDEVVRLAPELVTILGNRLTLYGPVPPNQVSFYMQNSEIFVLPSYAEGLPNVILEAMICGKPVVSTQVMGIPEAVIHDSTGILIQPGDMNAITSAIQRLIDDPTRAREMGVRGRERVMQQFNWEKNALEISSIFQDLIHCDE